MSATERELRTRQQLQRELEEARNAHAGTTERLIAAEAAAEEARQERDAETRALHVAAKGIDGLRAELTKAHADLAEAREQLRLAIIDQANTEADLADAIQTVREALNLLRDIRKDMGAESGTALAGHAALERLERELEEARRNGRGYKRLYEAVAEERDVLMAAAEEARQIALQLEHEKIALRADLAEARQETVDARWKHQEDIADWATASANFLAELEQARADLAEARQERDRATAAVDSMVAIVDAKSARIEGLEAALRRIADERRDWAEDRPLAEVQAIARAALQPTTDHEEP